MMALKMGKHVYCQKPLARTIGEVRALQSEATKRPKQVTQMGNQGHAAEGIRQIREWVEAGLIGPVRRVEYWTCLFFTSDAADEGSRVDLGGCRFIKKKKT